MNLRTLPCFSEATSDTFFPRCYRLSNEEDKLDFLGKLKQKGFFLLCINYQAYSCSTLKCVAKGRLTDTVFHLQNSWNLLTALLCDGCFKNLLYQLRGSTH